KAMIPTTPQAVPHRAGVLQAIDFGDAQHPPIILEHYDNKLVDAVELVGVRTLSRLASEYWIDRPERVAKLVLGHPHPETVNGVRDSLVSALEEKETDSDESDEAKEKEDRHRQPGVAAEPCHLHDELPSTDASSSRT